MARQLSRPFRFLPNGTAATVEQDSPEAKAELLAELVHTRRGERTLTPGFGITDPTFQPFDATELAAAVRQFGPDVELDAVEVTDNGAGVVTIDIQYT